MWLSLWLCVCDRVSVIVLVVVCWLRSGGEHCQAELSVEARRGTQPELTVEVRQGTLPSGAGGGAVAEKEGGGGGRELT